MVVCGVVVEKEMDIKRVGDLTVDVPEDGEQLLMAMPGLALGDDLAVGDIKCSKQRRRAVPDVIVGPLVVSYGTQH